MCRRRSTPRRRLRARWPRKHPGGDAARSRRPPGAGTRTPGSRLPPPPHARAFGQLGDPIAADAIRQIVAEEEMRQALGFLDRLEAIVGAAPGAREAAVALEPLVVLGQD